MAIEAEVHSDVSHDSAGSLVFGAVRTGCKLVCDTTEWAVRSASGSCRAGGSGDGVVSA